MRPLVVGLVLLVVPGGLLSDPPDERLADRLAQLVKQLGHNEFGKREEASKDLDAIGEPALDALRKAASDADAEVRRRAEGLIASITARVRAAVTKKELEKLQGTWFLLSQEVNGRQAKGEDQSYTLTFKGDKWSLHVNGQLSQAGLVRQIEVKANYNAIELPITEGSYLGATVTSIYAVEGDLLKYLNFEKPRATEFVTKPGDGRMYSRFRRAKPGAKPRPPETQFVSPVFSTDLVVPESKKAVHRVTLTCRPADGEAATLTFDPAELKFDAFGDPVADGKPAPVVTLDCTLKLVKAEKDRQLFEVRGSKVVSRLSLVVHKDTMPTGDGRLLVHGRAGEVRYVIDLIRPEMRFPPCHPGCFPAGTLVRMPGGTKAIERIREGDLVTSVDAQGKASPAKVTGVFVTRNRVLEVRTDAGTLVTTATQPVGLAAGGFREAGELKKGDRIWRWENGERRLATVTGVTAADREVDVFNLILGGPTAFVAGGFLVRSKPPAVAPLPKP